MAQTVHTSGWIPYPIGEYVPKEHELTGRAVENLALKKIPFTEYLILFGYIGVSETAEVSQTFWQNDQDFHIGDHGIIKAINFNYDVVTDVGGALDSVHAFRLEDQTGRRYAQMFAGKYIESTALFCGILSKNLFLPNLDIPFDDDVQFRMAGDYANLTGITFDIGANVYIYIQKQD